MSAANWWTSLISECKSLTGIENITNIYQNKNNLISQPKINSFTKASVLAYVSVMLFLILYIQGVVFF